MKKSMFAVALLSLLPVMTWAGNDLTLDSAIGGAIGGAVGGAIGAELGGRDGAVLGSGVGAAVGTALNTKDHRSERHHAYPEVHHYREEHHHYQGGYRPAHSHGFCPPGQHKKGRC